MKTTAVIIITLSFVFYHAEAQLLTAQTGLEKIKNNLKTAQKNKLEYNKNLELVKSNVAEVKRSRAETLVQKKLIYNEIVNNNNSLKKVLLQERHLNSYIEKENKKLAFETKQIEQLQTLIEQIKRNQEQRKLIIADYERQLTTNNNQKKSWKDREAQLRAQELRAIQALQDIASKETTWTNKKNKYENEAMRWAGEAQKQYKIHSTYRGLAESN